MVANHPNARIGITALEVQAEKATIEVKEVTNMADAPSLKALLSLRMGLSLMAGY